MTQGIGKPPFTTHVTFAARRSSLSIASILSKEKEARNEPNLGNVLLHVLTDHSLILMNHTLIDLERKHLLPSQERDRLSARATISSFDMLITDTDAMILFLVVVWVSLNVTFLESIPFHSRSGSEEEISSAISGFLLPEFSHDSSASEAAPPTLPSAVSDATDPSADAARPSAPLQTYSRGDPSILHVPAIEQFAQSSASSSQPAPVADSAPPVRRSSRLSVPPSRFLSVYSFSPGHRAF